MVRYLLLAAICYSIFSVEISAWPVEPIPNGTCVNRFVAKPDACQKIGSGFIFFGQPDSSSKEAFDECKIAAGCEPRVTGAIVGSTGFWNCYGTPICTPDSAPLRYCQFQRECYCDRGFKFVFNECRKIVCDGGYAAGERWDRIIQNGRRFWQCEVNGSIRTWVNCNVGFQWTGTECRRNIR